MSAAPWHALPPGLTPFAPGVVARYVVRPDRAAASLRSLERVLAERLHARRVIGTDSGTTALRIAIESAVSDGGVVALPAYGCFDFITAAVGAHRRVVLYDLDPATLAPDMSSLERVLGSGVEAVVVASLFGYAPPMPAIAAHAARSGVTLIEDAAQGAEARWGGRPLGSWGDFVTYSFGRGKGIGGAGGGALVVRGTREPVVRGLPRASNARALSHTGALLAQAVLGHPLLFAIPSAIPGLRLGETIYHEPWAPRGLHPLQAALAAAALSRDDSARAGRGRTAAQVAQAMAHAPGVRVVAPARESEPGFLRVGILADDATVARLRPLGARRAYPVPLALHDAMTPLLVARAEAPGAAVLANSLASLPCHRYVGAADVREMARRSEAA